MMVNRRWILALLVCVVVFFVGVYLRIGGKGGVEPERAAVMESPPELTLKVSDAVRVPPKQELDETQPQESRSEASERDLSRLAPADILKLLEARDLSVRDLSGLPDATLDEIAILRSSPLLSGWTPTTRESALDSLSKLPSEIRNPTSKVLTATDLEYLRAIRERYADSIALLAQEAIEELELHKQAVWGAREGVTVRREGEPPLAPREVQVGRFRSSQECGMLGRYVRFEYSSFSSNSLESKLGQIEELRAALASEQLRYLESLR